MGCTSGNKRKRGCFQYNQSREEVPLIATRGEEKKKPPLPQREKRELPGQYPIEEGLCVSLPCQGPPVPHDSWCSRASSPEDHRHPVNGFQVWNAPPASLPSTSSPTPPLWLGYLFCSGLGVASSTGKHPACPVWWGRNRKWTISGMSMLGTRRFSYITQLHGKVEWMEDRS